MRFRNKTALLLVSVFILAAIPRFINLGFPNGIVFDEYHFGSFANSYCCTQEPFFDIHPPHAKLTTAAVVKYFTNYPGNYDFHTPGVPFEGKVPIIHFRFVPALFGALIPVIAALLVFQLGGTLLAAAFAAIALSLENSLVVQSRVISLDTQLVFYELLAISTILAATRAKQASRKIFFSICCGASIAMAVGSKFTGLMCLALIMPIWVKSLARADKITRFSNLRIFPWIGCSFGFVYLLGWGVHFKIFGELNFAGEVLEGVKHFTTKIIATHQSMFHRNNNLVSDHSYYSSWKSWPIMMRGVYYWSGSDRIIYFLGNPAVWISSSLIILTSVVVGLMSKCSNLGLSKNSRKKIMIWVPLLGFCAAYFPYSLVKRGLYLYHYLPPLVFSIIYMTLWFQKVGLLSKGGSNKPRIGFYFFIVFFSLGFLVMLPLTYGIEAKAWHDIYFKYFPHWK